MKAEITTKKSFYRIVSKRKWDFHFWRYYKRSETKGCCWLIWRILLGWVDIECYALNNRKGIEELSASEALYGFCGWLFTREERVVMSAFDDAGIVADLVSRFCDENELSEPKQGWSKALKHPQVIKVLEKE
jgi:hypothetical protein